MLRRTVGGESIVIDFHHCILRGFGIIDIGADGLPIVLFKLSQPTFPSILTTLPSIPIALESQSSFPPTPPLQIDVPLTHPGINWCWVKLLLLAALVVPLGNTSVSNTCYSPRTPFFLDWLVALFLPCRITLHPLFLWRDLLLQQTYWSAFLLQLNLSAVFVLRVVGLGDWRQHTHHTEECGQPNPSLACSPQQAPICFSFSCLHLHDSGFSEKRFHVTNSAADSYPQHIKCWCEFEVGLHAVIF